MQQQPLDDKAGADETAAPKKEASHHEQIQIDSDDTRRRFLHLTGWRLQAAVVSVCSSGFLVFGYDQGVMSGVVISEIWLKEMGNPSSVMIGTITAIYDIGAIVGCLAAAFWGEALGRRKTLVTGCVAVIVGMLIMTTCYGRAQMMLGRVVTGIGIGFITSGISPHYASNSLPLL